MRRRADPNSYDTTALRAIGDVARGGATGHLLRRGAAADHPVYPGLRQDVARRPFVAALLIGLSLFARLAAAASTTAPTTSPAVSPATSHAVVLIHLPGIAGEMRIDHDLVAGLVAGGVATSATIYDWTGPDRGVPALTNVARHHDQARKVAAIIEGILAIDPRTPIVLVGHSAGTGVAVEALENLPPGKNVRTLLLLASALSPGYDLSRALAHVSGRAISLSSQKDDWVLGTGTRAFGTYDRVRTDAAGKIGFTPPNNADPAAYARLVQYPYDPAWTALSNGGDHIGVTSTRFARVILSPLVEGNPLPTTRPDRR